MPDSWSEKRKRELIGKPHMRRPDRDNCEKLILDALFTEDGGSWSGYTEKRWAEKGRVEIKMEWFK
jgi:Holliday junction resolvase RusA-like endonuclease